MGVLTRGVRNNNPLNIKFVSSNNWKGQISSDGVFSVFSEMVFGVRAALVLLKNYLSSGHNTIEKIITRFAPSSENDTLNYISFVEQKTGINRNKVLSFDADVFYKLVSAMCLMESGFILERSLFDDAYLKM